MENVYDVTIIGAGPAGLTAAIYARRANLSTAVIEYAVPGGKLYSTYEIDNYPGFQKISGASLGDELVEHAKKFNADFVNAKVASVNKFSNLFEVKLDNGQIIVSKTVIVASGTKEKKLELEHSDEFVGNGISYCAVCDGFFYKNKDVVVIGGGNSAIGESIYLADTVKHLTIFSHSKITAQEFMLNKLKEHQNVEIKEEIEPTENLLKDFDGVFVFIGKRPATTFMPKDLLDDKGYIKTENYMTKTPGIFAAGDVRANSTKQALTAAADGAAAALKIIDYLKS